jgi:hypothetical protein
LAKTRTWQRVWQNPVRRPGLDRTRRAAFWQETSGGIRVGKYWQTPCRRPSAVKPRPHLM